jgi:hypothetical protein
MSPVLSETSKNRFPIYATTKKAVSKFKSAAFWRFLKARI